MPTIRGYGYLKLAGKMVTRGDTYKDLLRCEPVTFSFSCFRLLNNLLQFKEI